MDNWKYGQEGEPALEQVELEKKKSLCTKCTASAKIYIA